MRKSLNNELELVKAQYYFYSSDYNACISHINKLIKKDNNNKLLLKFYLFLAEYMKGNSKFAYKTLFEILAEKPELVSYRSFFKNILEDGKIGTALKENYSEKEIQNMTSVIKKECQQKEEFIKNAKTLQKYYLEKAKQADKAEGIDA